MERFSDLYQKLDKMRCRLAELRMELESLKTEEAGEDTLSDYPGQPANRQEDEI